MRAWRTIEGYKSKYEVSNDGKVRSSQRTRRKLLVPFPVGKRRDYKAVRLCEDGREKDEKVHRLVAQAFIKNPLNKPQVNHINGNKFDNRVENLEWVTNGENQKHAYRTGMKEARKGEKHYRAKLKEIDVRAIRKLCNHYHLKQRDVAKIYNVSQSAIMRIMTGRNWKHL